MKTSITITIFDWACAVGAERLAPYRHQQQLTVRPSELFKIMEELYDKDLNVALVHDRIHKNIDAVLFVDTRVFSQR